MALSVKNTLGGGSIGSVENLFVPTLETTTLNGVTCTNNGDGTFTFNGTSTERIWFELGTLTLNAGTYKVCGMPQDVSANEVFHFYWNNHFEAIDNGSGATLTITSTETGACAVYIKANYTLNNVVVKPMITTNLKATYKEFVKRVGGFNNLVTDLVATYTQNGVTCTSNGDGTVTLNGTASTSFGMIIGTVKLTSGLKKYCGSPNFGGNSFMYMFDFTTATQTPYDYGDGAIFTATDDTYNIAVWCPQGFTFNNAVFKPMATESLMPTYYDFVNGVEGGITPQIFGYTKMDVQTFTVTASVNNKTITHSLGERPKLVLVFPCEGAIAEANFSRGNLIYAMMRMYHGSGFDSFPAYGVFSSIYEPTSALYPKESSSGQLNGNAFPSTSEVYMRGDGYFLPGYTYKVILMS